MGVPPTDELVVEVSDEQVAEFHERGFTHVERLTTDTEVAWLRERFAEVFAPGNENVLGGYFDASRPLGSTEALSGLPVLPQSIRPELRIPELLDTIAHRNARQISARLLGVAVGTTETWTHMIDKPPRTGHDTPWHQDEAFWELDLGYHACGVWLALDDVDRDNGCMEFIPASHAAGIVPHRHLHDDPMVERAGHRRRRRVTARCRCRSGRVARRSTRSGRCTTRARTAATGAVGPTPWRSSSPRSASTPRRSTPGRRSDRTRDAPHTAPSIGRRWFRSARRASTSAAVGRLGSAPGSGDGQCRGGARRSGPRRSRSSPAARRAPRLPQ